MQPLSAAMPPSGPGSAPDSGPVRPDPPVLRRCRPASSLTVLGSLVVDVLLIMIPMTVGLLPPLPQPARLALVLVALATLVLVVTNHALRGRSLGGALLGLRAVDIDAGLPPASLRSILAALLTPPRALLPTLSALQLLHHLPHPPSRRPSEAPRPRTARLLPILPILTVSTPLHSPAGPPQHRFQQQDARSVPHQTCRRPPQPDRHRCLRAFRCSGPTLLLLVPTRRGLSSTRIPR